MVGCRFFFVGTCVGCGTGEYVLGVPGMPCCGCWVGRGILEKRRRMRSLSVTFGEGREMGGIDVLPDVT